MKYVTKSLCAIAITIFISSCASKGSGCYDFGYESQDNKTQIMEHEYQFEVKEKKKNEVKPTICVD